mmetsp:Transcript_39749/g.113507  ORF Transcript_39749/g.113507 Transcript_39749/m.113507 type:complete len:246 (+) Transcript_39749:254-991(+)
MRSAKIICTTWFLTKCSSLLMSSQLASSVQISSSRSASMPSSMLASVVGEQSTSPRPAWPKASLSQLSNLQPNFTDSTSRVRTLSQVCWDAADWPSSACLAWKRARGASPNPGRRQPRIRGPALASSLAISTRASPSRRVKLATSCSRPPGPSSLVTPSRRHMTSSTLGSHVSTGSNGVTTVHASPLAPRSGSAASRKGPTTDSDVSMPWWPGAGELGWAGSGAGRSSRSFAAAATALDRFTSSG